MFKKLKQAARAAGKEFYLEERTRHPNVTIRQPHGFTRLWPGSKSGIHLAELSENIESGVKIARNHKILTSFCHKAANGG
ncbi:hypothetical protein [Mobiluncus mulieris]|uniref:Uncharacterized protein n=1 Tax=Mobiluncus mulieris TaxID=2052 RepID=A0ABD4TV76_9ACTO|nr:hypothetical protein [Mobiluncus mulieris]MCU9968789.1 hypothetical protein [Mobiluncus mulieris]MCU9973378.1 hypothetical protein [Mobiluncus mulieris]MCV0008898.1 hypothetical protein [Mobiluncus mulieris]NMW74626.1 hypothetical protein [Mobiluncus mulieris]NMX00561.1 hypothetical protein [Mobiluncus mulieris]